MLSVLPYGFEIQLGNEVFKVIDEWSMNSVDFGYGENNQVVLVTALPIDIHFLDEDTDKVDPVKSHFLLTVTLSKIK